MSLYIMAPEPISTVYFINPSHQSTCMFHVTRQRLGKNVTAATNTHAMELLDASFSMRSATYERRVRGSVYPFTVARKCLGKHVPAAMRNCWRDSFLCGPWT
jgi:hypothetical protein